MDSKQRKNRPGMEEVITGEDAVNWTGPKEQDDALPNEDARGEPGEGETAGALAEESDPAVLRGLLAEQSARADDYYARLARLQADYDNFRRRTRLEKEDFHKYAVEQMVCSLLPVLDNFELALAAEGDSIEKFKSGVELIHKQLLDGLATQGVTPLKSVGEQFDPSRHEVAFQEESSDHPDNTIIGEFRRGYCLKDKVVRPAMVKVAKSL